MAPLQVIGAGFGRTGTDSLREALDILGYNTHHMICFFENENLDFKSFEEALRNSEAIDWDKSYDGFDAAVDWPTCTFYKELIVKYPDAKVLLTVRTPESWYASVCKTIAPMSQRCKEIKSERSKEVLDMAIKVALGGILADEEKMKDEKLVQKLFTDHIEEVKRHVPSDRLLVMELGEGWGRLCQFLGKEVPKVPYPHNNATASFQDRVSKYYE
ncbi:hypothetical protein G6F46_010945 [Rhizopus delemar]|uniref:Sulfotransferase domain-containing protein n=3 Tax=Rhizopus TaxID=4842 RepID=I1CL37_RHIO9|nr:hypothetical protein RO3G_13878 [Rhizopus delemar RA 99-880]KAG1461264.1 hypothetical protein G6F55_003670 [Rhizopus delemar]KAG1545987.1 hypothetical protein G6F51_005147 [Rhizopus arrhizus]KAG1490616.1 hypothetical protein G6F54_010599 [Rhizopus delemar]KAG1502897.1 hypothetical protein G6F53_010759 [Rhizopus delemar]|eukprot:EIE89167.1 hypothetical protein RO3G_13878 [Rhizopus delemar RA 99-880]